VIEKKKDGLHGIQANQAENNMGKGDKRGFMIRRLA